MRQLHHLDVDIEARVWRSIVQRQYMVDALDLSYQRQQLRLAPDDYLAGNFSERLGETDELDGIAKSVIAANQHRLLREIFALPNALKMALSGVLDGAGETILTQTSIAELPGLLELVPSQCIDPFAVKKRIQPASRNSKSTGGGHPSGRRIW